MRPPSTCDPEVVLSSLRRTIAAGQSEPDALLNAIAEAAQAVTSAGGAAIALTRDGAVVCCARSGETAPTVGTRLSIESGISGECLRSGEPLRCDDSYTDHRVDPVVCRVLGLRSVAIVPVMLENKAAGILETFSTRAYAFNAQHMAYLKQLSELTTAVYANPQKRWAASLSAHEIAPVPLESTGRSVPSYASAAIELFSRLEPARKHRVAGLVLAALALASLLLGWTLHKPQDHPSSTNIPSASLVSTPPQTATEMPETEEIMVPAPALRIHERSSAHPVTARRVERNLPAKEPDEATPEVVTRIIIPSEIKDSLASAPSGKTAPPRDAQPLEEPKLELASSDNAALKDLIVPRGRTPKFTPPISGGVSPAILVRKIQPIYPANARVTGLRGSVSLQITILKDGTVGDTKVVEGNPVLASAAMDAVRQWRYRPTLLNGTPVQTQAEVVVNFQTP